jgi:hypothetical protein
VPSHRKEDGMKKSFLQQWREDIVGEWQQELSGVDLLYLQPVTIGRVTLTLGADGTSSSKSDRDAGRPRSPRPEPPFPETWELSDDRVLTFVVPRAPMPEYEMPDWGRERHCFDVLAVTDLSLTLSDRRFDGESVTVWRRVDCEAFMRRKYAVAFGPGPAPAGERS